MTRKKGDVDSKPREKKYSSRCIMCGGSIESVRPGALTDKQSCRSALRHFRKLWGCDPLSPPGVLGVRPMRHNWETWCKAYLPHDHPKNVMRRDQSRRKK